MEKNVQNDATLIVLWCKNYSPNYVEILREIYGEWLGNHFASKLNGFMQKDRGDGEVAWINLYLSMTDHNRDLLLNYLRKWNG